MPEAPLSRAWSVSYTHLDVYKRQLLCTEKAQPVIARGREVQERFFARLLQNTDAATREAFFRTMEIIGKNLDEILKENG